MSIEMLTLMIVSCAYELSLDLDRRFGDDAIASAMMPSLRDGVCARLMICVPLLRAREAAAELALHVLGWARHQIH